MTAPVKEIIALLNARYPFAWAVPGDRVGLLVGHPQEQVDTLLVALEVGTAVVEEARTRGAQMLLTHHPLLYQPLSEVRADQPGGGLLTALIRGRINVAACHTNLDVAPGGVNDYLARLLELTELEVLSETQREPWYKLTTFVPLGYEDRVRQALADDRIGVIGRYSHCSFACPGQGTYRPLEGAHPWRGEVAALSRAAESRLEILVPAGRLEAATTRLKASHPYEEPAYDIYPLHHPGTPLGLGRIGAWPAPRAFPAVISRIKEVFEAPVVRIWGRPPAQVQRVALCGGSGGDFITLAQDKGAQLYLTGEVRHHQATPGNLEEFCVVEVGHFNSEVIFMPEWARQLRGHFQEAGLQVQVQVAEQETPPCSYR
jgi:dinuclear metal center YbgI/SA1388 family protein